MSHQQHPRQMIWAILIMFLLVGCGFLTDTLTPNQSTGTSAEDSKILEVGEPSKIQAKCKTGSEWAKDANVLRKYYDIPYLIRFTTSDIFEKEWSLWKDYGNYFLFYTTEDDNLCISGAAGVAIIRDLKNQNAHEMLEFIINITSGYFDDTVDYYDELREGESSKYFENCIKNCSSQNYESTYTDNAGNMWLFVCEYRDEGLMLLFGWGEDAMNYY